MAILSKTPSRAGGPATGRPPGPGGASGAPGAGDPTAAAVSLRAVRKSYGGGEEAVRGIDLDVAAGEFFALLGPSGCGKTTTLKLIGGFEQPTAGELLIQGRAVAGVPAFQRDVNTVFQNYALFPHLDVRDNVAFGLRMKGVGRAQRRARAEEALERVHLPDVARRRIDELSGGQQQRVALARALVNRPAVLLLDEPLGALDLKLRRAMQQELKEIQRSVGICFVYVTHDQHEALTMADRIAVMHDGRVEQVGTPAEIYERPASRFVAQFIGDSGFLSGTVRAVEGGIATVALADGGDGAAGAEIRVPVGERSTAGGPATGATVTVAVRPERVRLAEAGSGTAEENVLTGTVVEAEYVGSDHLYRVQVGGAGVLAAREPAAGRVPRAPGTAVAAAFAVGSGVLLEEAAP